MGWQRGEGDGPGAVPGSGPGAPDGPDAPGIPDPRGGVPRDARLAGSARAGEWDRCRPGPELAAVLAGVGGAEWRCPGAEPDELVGVLRRVAALESWASAAKLGGIRELIRQDDRPAAARSRHGDLPDQCSDSLNHELALALASSVASAEQTALTAWELGARLPNIAALLADGTLAYSKARLIVETFQLLSDADATRAEAMIIPQLTGTTGKTYGQIMHLAPSPRPGPRLRVHVPVLLAARPRVGLRARPAVPQGRPDLRLQRGRTQQKMPPDKAVTRLERHPAQTRLARMDDTNRQNLHPGPLPIPGVDPGTVKDPRNDHRQVTGTGVR
jgi:hypothetical protein